MRLAITPVGFAVVALGGSLLGPIDAAHADGSGFGLGARPAIPTSGFGYVDRSGMNEHVVRGAFEGLLTGGSIGYALSSGGQDASRVGTGALLGAAAGIVLPLAFNRDNKEVRSGDVVFINAAQNWGFAHGLLLPVLFQLSDSSSLSRDEWRLDFGLAAGLSLAAGAWAASASSALSFTPGQASAIGSSGIWGGLAGWLVILTASPSDRGRHWDQAAIATGLGLGDVAMLTTWANRSSFDVDRSRVALMNIGGGAGLLVGLAAAYFIDPSLDNDRVITASLLVGGGVGVASGFYLSDGWDEYKKAVPPSSATGLSLLELQQGRWSVGVPMPRPAPATGFRGEARVRALLSLADGRF
jgi:hypothetical protein